jgi:hypothetical protein
MGANPQSLQHLSSMVLQPAENISLGGKWEFSQVRRHVILVQYRRKILAE